MFIIKKGFLPVYFSLQWEYIVLYLSVSHLGSWNPFSETLWIFVTMQMLGSPLSYWTRISEALSETWIVNKLPINADILEPVHFSSVQSISHVWFFATPWIEAHQASLSITNLRSLLKYMAIELVMPSNHLILCHPLPLPPSFFSSIRVFSNESVLHSRWPKYWSFSISPSSENI